MKNVELPHFFHDDHSFGDLKGFGFALKPVWGVGGG